MFLAISSTDIRASHPSYNDAYDYNKSTTERQRLKILECVHTDISNDTSLCPMQSKYRQNINTKAGKMSHCFRFLVEVLQNLLCKNMEKKGSLEINVWLSEQVY